MKSIVIGLGIQGRKRKRFLGNNCAATVDVISSIADYSSLEDVPLDLYDLAYLCTPDSLKIDLLKYLVNNKKHILVEKPLLSNNPNDLLLLKSMSQKKTTTIYTAYNHRFEPHIKRMKELVDSNFLGKIYHCKMFYGNGTARDIKNSPWRKNSQGVIVDLGSHLLDLILYFFNNIPQDFSIVGSHCFENKTFDHASFHSEKMFPIDLEMSYVCWKNTFTCDIFGENGSAHIESLCKWRPSKYILRKRKLPSGIPDEESITIVQDDTTWIDEQNHLWKLCENSKSNIENDLIINKTIQNLIKQL